MSDDLWLLYLWSGEKESKVSSPMSKAIVSITDLGPGTLDLGLSFNTDYLFDLSDDFNQILLVLHHRFD
jgi:hypothetical protein